MIKFRFSNEKAEKLLKERNISIEEVIEILSNYDFLDLFDNPNPLRKGQIIFVVNYKNYPHTVRCLREGEDEYFIKTIVPERSLKKKYGFNQEEDSHESI